MRSNRFAQFAWFVLFFNVPVIAWASYVRLSFSGDGCGNSWPDCGGTFLPNAASATPRLIEFTHRFSTGIDGLFMIALLVGAFLAMKRSLSSGAAEPKWAFGAALLAFIFTGFEVVIGRFLVQHDLVGWNASVQRAQTLSLHLTNTLVLMAGLTLCALWSSGTLKPRLKGQGAVGWLIGLGCFALIFVSASGAITSLGDKLFPPANTPKAITDAMDTTKHFLIQLRVLHPIISTCVGIYMVLVVGLVSHLRKSAEGLRAGRWVLSAYGVQIGLGLLNVALHAPDIVAVIHLSLSVLIWIAWICWSARCLAWNVVIQEGRQNSTPHEKARLKDYIVLTKPKVISLLLFTTLTALFASAQGSVSFGLFLAVFVGGYLAAGAANAINMVIDRDIDGSMKRTSTRPTVTETIPPANALIFGCLLALISFVLLWSAANLLTALLALAGLAFYVVIYTLVLKRRTWQNIVIGGAAGSFPPLVGWAASRGQLDVLAWLLFAIIFVWTPVHFWALALMIKDEYAKVNVPMLPVVKGERATVVQIAWYGVATAIVSVLPFFVKVESGPGVEWLYLTTAIALNALLLVRCYQLLVNPDRPHALKLYKYSMLYLALLFLAFAIDCSIPKPRGAHVQASNPGSIIGVSRSSSEANLADLDVATNLRRQGS